MAHKITYYDFNEDTGNYTCHEVDCRELCGAPAEDCEGCKATPAPQAAPIEDEIPY